MKQRGCYVCRRNVDSCKVIENLQKETKQCETIELTKVNGKESSDKCLRTQLERRRKNKKR